VPNAAPRGCDTPNCLNLALPHSWRCAQHQATDVEDRRAADKQRNRKDQYRALYNTDQWKFHNRPACRARDPLCRLQITPLCKQHGGDASEIAHHIIDHKGNLALFFSMDNIMGVCKACHDKHTGSTRGGAPIHAAYCLMRKNLGVCSCPVSDASVDV
jgi:5-methylcytosine-specific restriction protein A